MLREPLLLIAEMLLYFGAMLGLSVRAAAGARRLLLCARQPAFSRNLSRRQSLRAGAAGLDADARFGGAVFRQAAAVADGVTSARTRPWCASRLRLLLGNLLVIAMVAVLRGHEPLAKPDGSAPDLGLLGEMAG